MPAALEFHLYAGAALMFAAGYVFALLMAAARECIAEWDRARAVRARRHGIGRAL